MPRRTPVVQERSYGLYQRWSGRRGDVPQLIAFRETIPARPGVEFGYVLHVVDGHGVELSWRIEHPPFPGRDGKPTPAFAGGYHVRGNDFAFFLGDTVWEPWQDKCGPWTLITSIGAREVARRTLLLLPPDRIEDA